MSSRPEFFAATAVKGGLSRLSFLLTDNRGPMRRPGIFPLRTCPCLVVAINLSLPHGFTRGRSHFDRRRIFCALLHSRDVLPSAVSGLNCPIHSVHVYCAYIVIGGIFVAHNS